MHIASVDGKELSHALRQLKSTPGTKRGTAFWVFGEELRIDWSGASKSIAARVAEPVPSGIVVDCNVMKQVTARLNYDGPTDIRFEDDALLIGRDRIGAHKATATRQVALPVDADDADVLLATLGFSPEGMADSGYGVEADEVVSKLKKSLSTAAKALLWTSLGPDRLGDMVMDELIAKARRIKERYEIPTEGPRWKFSSGEAHVDHIGREEEGLIYFYTWNNLDAVQIDNFKLRQMILHGLSLLSGRGKRLSQRAFTVYGGDLRPGSSHFGIGISTTNGDVANFLRDVFDVARMEGPHMNELGRLYPLFRYDHGHVVEYVLEEVPAGRSYLDDEEEGFGSGLTFYTRHYRRIPGTRSKYGKLLKD
jgi:hypothetical protein